MAGRGSGGGVVIARARTIVTADPELDDLNSLLRLLLYTNEIDVQGLVYASSRFHWRGDGRGTEFFLPDREYSEPRTSWRWAADERFIHDAVEAYAEVYPNLRVHDARYPEPDAVRGVIRFGNVDFEGDMSSDTPGSTLIADTLLDDDPRPVHLQLWAGPATVARALRSIEERHSGTDAWPRVRAEVSRKAIITKFASQDATYDDYIRPVWPDIRVTEVATMAWGYLIRETILDADRPLLSAEWMRENVTSVGPIGGLYRVWGDGRQMVPGDPTDFFHLSGRTADELRADGYQVWMPPQPAGEWISEGDTTNMLNLIVPGLRAHEHPSFGGWGGRAARTDVGRDTWATADARRFGATPGEAADEFSVTRWFADAQADFAARLRWSVTPEFAGANHHPRLEVADGLDRRVNPGETITLAATASADSPTDAVDLRWRIVDDAGTCAGVVLESVPTTGGAVESLARVSIPADADPGTTVHVIAEARDRHPSHPLASWRRVILTVE